MADGIENSGRRCAAGLTTAAVVVLAGAGAPAWAAAEKGDAAAAGRGGEAVPMPGRPHVPASAAFAPGLGPSVTAALAPVAADGGENAGTVEGATLSVQVSDDRDTIAAGDEATYTLTLRNESDEAQEAIVSQRVSAKARFVDVEGDGMATGGVATWRVPVEAGAEAERTARVRIGEPGQKLWRVATTVCAQTEAGAPPVACATDANRVEPAAGDSASAVSVPQRVLTVASIVTATLLVLTTGAAVFVVWNRLRLRFGAGPAPGRAAGDADSR
ncbi:DUF11 domain-containing protein [Streptomonospora litoralis]|uniref:Uncharacterized protein n=1 Tax=Streptomonospora litoralis TaxID=2498135 RepID=A0A4P6Q101_9ACTN|nr:DUF11 domain-containing protein [Streptomonospora litoralis]QBI53750.1 hypothetical protein EKD16_09810 [Streptomonospora litoralis]